MLLTLATHPKIVDVLVFSGVFLAIFIFVFLGFIARRKAVQIRE